MKKTCLKLSALLLAVLLAAVSFVRGFAYTADSGDIVNFNARFKSDDIAFYFTDNHLLEELDFTFDNQMYSEIELSRVRVVLFDSNQTTLFDSAVDGGYIEGTLSSDYFFLEMELADSIRLNRNKEFTVVVSEGSMTGPDSRQSPEYRVDFQPDEFLSPSIWELLGRFFKWLGSWFG